MAAFRLNFTGFDKAKRRLLLHNPRTHSTRVSRVFSTGPSCFVSFFRFILSLGDVHNHPVVPTKQLKTSTEPFWSLFLREE